VVSGQSSVVRGCSHMAKTVEDWRSEIGECGLGIVDPRLAWVDGGHLHLRQLQVLLKAEGWPLTAPF